MVILGHHYAMRNKYTVTIRLQLLEANFFLTILFYQGLRRNRNLLIEDTFVLVKQVFKKLGKNN